jgi:hypothetical protein
MQFTTISHEHQQPLVNNKIRFCAWVFQQAFASSANPKDSNLSKSCRIVIREMIQSEFPTYLQVSLLFTSYFAQTATSRWSAVC